MSGRAINWYLQRITGIALLVLLIMHFWVEHFAAEVRTPEGLTFEVIQARFFRNPWFVAVDITFLFIALYHGLNGIRNICLDYNWGIRLRRPITIILLVVGIVVAYWGVTAFTGNPHLKQTSSHRGHESGELQTRGLVHFSAAENMDLTPSFATWATNHIPNSDNRPDIRPISDSP